MEFKEGLTFDDVLLEPKKNIVSSRKDVDTRTKFSRNISLKIPIVSANMDTVTESAMAITLARLGGIGVIHRFLTIEQQVDEVLKVKRSESFIIEKPCTLPSGSTLQDAKNLMSEKSISGILIVDNDRLIGIITSKDLMFETELGQPISNRMTKNVITARPETTLYDAKKILHNARVEKLPLIDKDCNLKGLITAKDILKHEQYPEASKDTKGRLRVAAAIGIKGDYLERAGALAKAEVDALVLDIAHGHSDDAIEAIKIIKKEFPNIDLVAGNVATKEAVHDMMAAGVDGIKTGVGPGSICITRIVTGAGIPQLTAIIECAKASDVPVIADGGIKTSGDITKALAAGASSVMIGNLLAGTDESPGISIVRNNRKYKINRGMASLAATINRNKEMKDKEFGDVVPEGVEAIVPYKGSAHEIINQLTGGLRSGISYCGARNILELQQNAVFIKMSPAGLHESRPHDVEQL